MDWDPRGTELGRAELEELLDRLETAASSPGYSGRIREQAAREAAVVRTRLQEGDFQVGDRVILQVLGEFADTVAVEPGRVITLPGMGPIPLAGVLRSELEEHLTRELATYLRDPVVEASSLIRIAVLGRVGQQGFYTMPASLLVEEALMLAGGPAPEADLDEAEILRGDRVIWEDDALQRAIVEGRTLDQLSLRAGDRIMIPVRQRGIFEGGLLRTLLVVVPPLTYTLLRIFR
jgi:protein involved in polysaccharide export with SLBB domain